MKGGSPNKRQCKPPPTPSSMLAASGERAVEKGKRTEKEVHLENLARVREIVRKNIMQADTAYKTEL